MISILDFIIVSGFIGSYAWGVGEFSNPTSGSSLALYILVVTYGFMALMFVNYCKGIFDKNRKLEAKLAVVQKEIGAMRAQAVSGLIDELFSPCPEGSCKYCDNERKMNEVKGNATPAVVSVPKKVPVKKDVKKSAAKKK